MTDGADLAAVEAVADLDFLVAAIGKAHQGAAV